MQTINEKAHYSTLISSLNKQYELVRLGGNYTPSDIYLLDVIYNLLNGCCLILDVFDIKKLLDLYNTILHKSNSICNNNYQDKYQTSKRNRTIQAEKEDCNNIGEIDNLYYWQETNIANTQQNILSEITSLSYFSGKNKSSLTALNAGITIPYTSVGRISFFIVNSESINYEVRDIDGLLITNAFDIVLSTTIKGALITTKNIYSYGNIFFKIKKL